MCVSMSFNTCSIHPEIICADMRRHDSKHAASITLRLSAGYTHVSTNSCFTCRPWRSQHPAHSEANIRRHDSSMPLALLAASTYILTRSWFASGPCCSQHPAQSEANMRRHAASIADWKHLYFHHVQLYMQAHNNLRIRERICASMTQSMLRTMRARSNYIPTKFCFACRAWCAQQLAHSTTAMPRPDSNHTCMSSNWHLTFRPWRSQRDEHSKLNMRWHDSKHAASFTCRPWSSQHLAYLKRRHDSKAAASNAGVTHIFHTVLHYIIRKTTINYDRLCPYKQSDRR